MTLFFSCSDKYHAFKSQYSFRSADGRPDYSDLRYWAAHPWKWDPSDSIPAPLQYEIRDSTADVFFLHPTTYTRGKRSKSQNAGIDDDYINAKTDYSSILYQASVFNNHARVFAPRYRQAHLSSFFLKDKEKAAAAFDMAYEDLRTAFDYYIKNWNRGRPIIIASHSQGSFLAERLLKDYFDGPSNDARVLRNQLVVAYVTGWPVHENYFISLSMCKDSLETGCICSWRTLRRGFVPRFIKNDTVNSYVTNPLTWTTGAEHASRTLNKGSVLIKFNKVYPYTTDAQTAKGLLYVKKPKFPGSFLYFKRNYHIGDINLYYLNIRENAARRIEMFRKKQ